MQDLTMYLGPIKKSEIAKSSDDFKYIKISRSNVFIKARNLCVSYLLENTHENTFKTKDNKGKYTYMFKGVSRCINLF